MTAAPKAQMSRRRLTQRSRQRRSDREYNGVATSKTEQKVEHPRTPEAQVQRRCGQLDTEGVSCVVGADVAHPPEAE